MDLIIQKAAELGATEIMPVSTARSQRWLASNKATAKYERWRKISQEAARQCGRNRVPKISPLGNLSEVIRQAESSGVKLIFWEEESQGGLKQALAAASQTDLVYALVGPEGGFSLEEIAQAEAAGFQSVSLGRRVLRTETAAIVALSLLQYELGDLGLLP
jgi:16S rRNA (uracil1498-N3)-methyltransferase